MLRHMLDAKASARLSCIAKNPDPKSTISKCCPGKKPFSRTMIRTLANFFQGDTERAAANLLRKPVLRRARKTALPAAPFLQLLR